MEISSPRSPRISQDAPVSIATKIYELGNEINKVKKVNYLQYLNLNLDSPRMRQAMKNIGVLPRELKLQ